MNEAFVKLLCLLKVAYENLLVLHHNLVGCCWLPVHEQLGGYYELIADMGDDLVEIGLALGIPEPTIQEAITAGAVLSAEPRDERTSLAEAKRIFHEVIAQIDAVADVPADVKNKLQEYQLTLRKEADYKLARAAMEMQPAPPAVDPDDDY